MGNVSVLSQTPPLQDVSRNLTRILNLSRKWVASFTLQQLYSLGRRRLATLWKSCCGRPRFRTDAVNRKNICPSRPIMKLQGHHLSPVYENFFGAFENLWKVLVSLCLRPSAWNYSVLNGRIFMKFSRGISWGFIGGFHEVL